jgi:hypothetical protein
MQDDRHCKACGHLFAMHHGEGLIRVALKQTNYDCDHGYHMSFIAHS